MRLTGHVKNQSKSLPDLSVGLGVDAEDKLCTCVGLHGRGDDHILSRLQTVLLNQIPGIVVHLSLLHRLASPKEVRSQTSGWRLEV